MSEEATETRAVVIERDLPYPPEKIWRALTQSHLIEEWLMKTEFEPVTGHRFDLNAAWGAVHCEVKTVEPNETLSYSWDTKDLRSVITWTLTPTNAGTRLRMEQTGFRPDQEAYYRGASAQWPNYFAAIERIVAQLD